MFLWKKELELGIPSIDEQHKKLLEIGNRINDLILDHREGNDNYDEITDVIRELKDYTVYHFQNEQVLLEKYHYPDYDGHKKEHDDFIAYLNGIDINEVEDDQIGFLKALLAKLIKWIFNHIISTDFLYRDFLLRLGAE